MTTRGMAILIWVTGFGALGGSAVARVPQSGPGGLGHAVPGQRNVRCPAALSPGPSAPETVLSAARGGVQALVPRIGRESYRITFLLSLQGGADAVLSSSVWRRIAASHCGKLVADRSWAVGVVFVRPAQTANMSGGTLYLARTAAGWATWDWLPSYNGR